jgi:acyl carrier protein
MEDLKIADGFKNWNSSKQISPLLHPDELTLDELTSVGIVEELVTFAKSVGYKVGVTWSQNSPGELDVVFGAKELPEVQSQYKYKASYLTNMPQLSNLKSIFTNEIRQYLVRSLPAYMIPNRFNLLQRMPLTPNGKIDKQALLELDDSLTESADYVEPRNDLEIALCEIWEETLLVGTVGIRDNFFTLGGHSLLVVQLHNTITNSLNVKVSVSDLFRYPTVEKLASLIKNNERARGPLGVDQSPYVIFVFPTEFGEDLRIVREFYEIAPDFRRYIEECFSIFRINTGTDLSDFLIEKEQLQAPSGGRTCELVRDSLAFSVGYALAKWWLSIGLSPSLLVGSGYVYECVAASLSGSISLHCGIEYLLCKYESEYLNCSMSEGDKSSSARIEAEKDDVESSSQMLPYISSFTGEHASGSELADNAPNADAFVEVTRILEPIFESNVPLVLCLTSSPRTGNIIKTFAYSSKGNIETMFNPGKELKSAAECVQETFGKLIDKGISVSKEELEVNGELEAYN